MCSYITKVLGLSREKAHVVLDLFEKQVLVFPVLVVVLACVSFFFGGTCAAWQWWVAVVIVMLMPWIKCNRNAGIKEAIFADSLFIILIAVVFLASPLTFDLTGNPDYPQYHLPTIRLLIEGWNPINDPSATDICARLGLSLDGMSFVHVAFIARVGAIFNACAAFFVQDPYSLTFPLVIFLYAAVFFSALRAFYNATAIVGIFAVCILWKHSSNSLYVDDCMLLASAGLLFEMYHCLKVNKIASLPLIVFSMWMMNLKLPGCLAAFICWTCYSIVVIVRNKRIWSQVFCRLALVGVALLVMFGVVSYSPYGTSLRDYGHPLYPFKTVDAEKFPVKNITWDFLVGNSDYEEMGYWGEFFNAYICPGLVRKYYNWKLGRDDFSPYKYVWSFSMEDTGVRSPTTMKQRLCIWGSIALLLFFPGLRVFGVMLLCCLVAFPREYMGFLRYQPWLYAFWSFGVISIIVNLLSWRRLACVRKGIFVAMLLIISWHCLMWIFQRGWIIRERWNETAIDVDVAYVGGVPMRSRVSDKFIQKYLPARIYAANGCRQLNAAILLMRSLGKEDVDVFPLEECFWADYHKTPFAYYIDLQNKDFSSNSNVTVLQKISARISPWVCFYPKMVVGKVARIFR